MTNITVKDLRAMLEEFPEDLIVCTAGDDEGNSFRLLYDDAIVPGWYDKEDCDFTTWGEEDDDGNEQPLKPEECNAVCIW